MEIVTKIKNWIVSRYKIMTLLWQIKGLKKNLNKIYLLLGEDYVTTHKNDPDDVNRDKILEAVRLQKEIGEKQSSVDEMRGIVRCIACGERIPNGAMFCPYCGMRQPDPEVKVIRFCPQCGTKLEVDELYCHHCGTRIPEANAETEEITTLHTVVKNPGTGKEMLN